MFDLSTLAHIYFELLTRMPKQFQTKINKFIDFDVVITESFQPQSNAL